MTKSLSASSLVDPPSWTAPASGRGDTSVRAIQAGNLLAWEANESLISKEESALGSDVRVSSADDERSPSGVYEMFMSAILALFSYRLAKLHNYLPLNSRSFLSPQSDLPTLDTFLDTNEPLERGEVSLLVTLDIRLTNTGTLMVTSSTAPSGLFCATPRLPAESKHLQPGVTDLWLSPGGRVARYIGSVPMGTRTLHNSKDSSWEGERHDAKTHFWDGQLESIWKDRVRDWLAGRGISLAATEQEEWVAVQILFFRDPNAEDQATSQETTTVKSDDLRTTLWPAELCFLREKSEPDAFDTDLGWFHSSDDTGISDPLTFAEDWFDARLLREDILISAKSARQADELLAQQSKLLKTAVQDSNLTDEPYVRVSNYLDLHTANVVYPTPPDGTHTQGSTGAQAHIGIGSTPDNGDGGNLDHRAETTATTEDAIVRSSPTDEHVYGSDERRNSDISQLGMPSTAYDVSGGNLFRDMDADMFGTSGITEADFSFFDEPDLDDVESQIYEPNGPTSRANPSLHADVVPHHVQGGFTDEFSSLVQSDSRQHELPSGAALAIAVETADRSMDGSTRGNQVDQEALPFDAAELDDNQDAPLISFDSREEKDAKGHYFPSPPLSPISVKKKLLPTINGPLDTPGEPTNVASGRASEHGSNNGSCRQSTFEPVVFAGNLDFSDQKYKLNGRFSIELQEKFAPQKSRSQRPNIPSIGLPRRKQNSSLSNTIDPFPTAVMKEKDTPLYPVVAGEADEEKDENFFESKESDQDDSSYTTTDEVVLTLAPGLKRKRDIADDWDDLVDSTSHRPLVDSPIEEENQNWTPLLSLSRFSPDASDWCLTDYRQQLDDGTVKLANMSDQEYVRVAQILTDQVVFSSLSFSRHSLSLSGLTSPPKIPPRKEEQAAIAEVVESLFEKCSLCDLENYAAIEDKPWDTPAAVRKLPKPPRRNTTSGGEFRSSNCHFFKLPAPHIRVQRAETPIEVLSPALPFWESFGFGPVSGTKDVIAFCVYPSSEGLEDAADAFLEGLGNVYESCKLGSHTRGDKLGQSRRGLLPIIPSEANPKYEIVIGEVKEACEELGKTSPPVLELRLITTQVRYLIAFMQKTAISWFTWSILLLIQARSSISVRDSSCYSKPIYKQKGISCHRGPMSSFFN